MSSDIIIMVHLNHPCRGIDVIRDINPYHLDKYAGQGYVPLRELREIVPEKSLQSVVDRLSDREEEKEQIEEREIDGAIPKGLDPNEWTPIHFPECTWKGCEESALWKARKPMGHGIVKLCLEHARQWNLTQFEWLNEDMKEIIKKAQRRYGH